jgi:hypothetical protein
VAEGDGVGEADGLGEAVGDCDGDADEWGIRVRVGSGQPGEGGAILWCGPLCGFELCFWVEPSGSRSPSLPSEPGDDVPAMLLDATAGAPPPLP